MSLKKLVDFSIGGVGAIAALPLFALVAGLIKLEDGGPVFFVQQRVGRNGRNFPCIKFRTMIQDAEKQMAQWKAENSAEWQEYVASNYKLLHDPRITRVGKLLRRTSLDELPQLVNVLKGDMSLVGPRPLLASEVEHYGADRFAKYCEMLPGISGLWQVSGRSDTTFEMRADLDMRYWERRGFLYDLRILLRTVGVVFGKQGAY